MIGIECRTDDTRLQALLAPRARCYEQLPAGERAFAARLGGSCQSPVAAHATLIGTRLQLRGLVGSPDGACVFRAAGEGLAVDGGKLGIALAEELLAAGAGPLLESLRSAGAG